MPDKPRSDDDRRLEKEMLTHVKDWLRFRKMSQRRIAEAMDVSEPTVSKWLSGDQGMSLAQFVTLARLLKATPAELLGPPNAIVLSGIMYRLAEVATKLPDKKLETLIASGEAMLPDDGTDT